MCNTCATSDKFFVGFLFCFLPSLLYHGFRTWKLALFSMFQTVMDVVPRAQSWSQFVGLNSKEKTSLPACACVHIGSAFSQFLQHTVMIKVTMLLTVKQTQLKRYMCGTLNQTVDIFLAYHTVMLWSGREEQQPKYGPPSLNARDV